VITSRRREYGFREGEYRRFIVTWGWTEDARREADAVGIELWDFRDVVGEIAAAPLLTLALLSNGAEGPLNSK
jgi:hypothetical protein